MASPVVQNQRPADGDTLVAPYQPAYLEITDADNDLVAASVIIKYNGRVAWSGDAAQDGFAVTKTAITNGFSYSVLPHMLPGKGSTVQIDVYADDGVNTVTDEYYYEIGVREYQLRFDDFDDASLDPALVVINGNGSVTEPAGTELKLDCPNSVDCNWWASVDNAPKAYFPFEQWILDRSGVFQLETKLSGFDSTVGVAFGGGPMLYKDSQNAYFGGYYDGVDDIRWERGIANSFSSLYNSADNRVDPNTTPHLYRAIWNRSPNTFMLEDSTLLQPGEITFLYSENLGSSWVRAHTQTLAISPTELVGFGVWLKKWAAGPTDNSQAYVDYLELKELVPDELELDASDGLGGHVEVSASGRARSETDTDTHALDRGADGHVEITNAVAPDELPLRLSDSPTAGHVEILAEAFLSVTTDYRTDTNDFNGHPHFIGERVLKAFIYHADDEAGPWTTPTAPSFTGYGKDGKYYINGVVQVSNAPWYDEVESDDRGPTKPFPDKVLICYTATGSSLTPAEVVIFDLDNFPTTLNVWMRFKFGPSGGNYTMMGRINQKVTDVAMANGILTVVCTEGDYRGHLILVNFTQPGKDCGHLIRSDNHIVWQPSGEIADRNLTGASQWTTSGVTVSLRTDEEQIHSVAALPDGADTWVAIGGEDPGPNLYKVTDHPVIRVPASGASLGDANIGDKRRMAFDEDKNWWLTIEDRIHRVLEYDYKEGYINIDVETLNHRAGAARSWIRLPHDITDFVSVGDYLFVATEVGVYRVHRGNLDYALAYTIVGGGGGGTSDSPPAGELIPGDRAEVIAIGGAANQSAHYLFIATPTSVCVVRTLDDVAVDSRNFPELHWPNPHFNAALVL